MKLEWWVDSLEKKGWLSVYHKEPRTPLNSRPAAELEPMGSDDGYWNPFVISLPEVGLSYPMLADWTFLLTFT
jgi:hypothetical protein